MPKYNDNFNLDIHDIDLIEKALRVMWSEDEKNISADQGFPGKTTDRIRSIHNLLGKISCQKIYYGEVNKTSYPIG
jgi:hypothetical protein